MRGHSPRNIYYVSGATLIPHHCYWALFREKRTRELTRNFPVRSGLCVNLG